MIGLRDSLLSDGIYGLRIPACSFTLTASQQNGSISAWANDTPEELVGQAGSANELSPPVCWLSDMSGVPGIAV
jgi:hypothetical protein